MTDDYKFDLGKALAFDKSQRQVDIEQLYQNAIRREGVLKEENQRLRELLRKMEFKAYDEKFNDNYCLICDANETDGHTDDCELKMELSDG
jgi:hypothetical protein